jgi:histone-lysine N-methyltransferase SETMAR
METLNQLQQRIRRVRPKRNMKDVLLLHDNARPHTSLRTREAIAKMGWAFPPHPPHSPDLAPSDCHLFGHIKNALRGGHFEDDSEFYIVIQLLTQRWQKCVENDGGFAKNSFIIAKDVWKIRVNFDVGVTCSDKRIRGILVPILVYYSECL